MSTASALTGRDRNIRKRHAPHIGPSFRADIQACEEALLDTSALRYLGHFTNGVFDFAVEVNEPASWTGDLDRVGRLMCHSVEEFDEVCAPLDCGPLIRVVLHGSEGALLHVVKVGGQSVLGRSGPGEPQAKQADRRIFQILEAAAERIGAGSLNWGGFRDHSTLRGLGHYGPGTDALDRSIPVTKTRNRQAPAPGGTVEQALEDSLSLRHLHFAGVYDQGTMIATADILDDPGLLSYFQRVSPDSRRANYEKVARQVWMQTGAVLNRMLRQAGAGPMYRLVLDVARGAIYVAQLGGGRYLLAVTLDQRLVEDADDRFSALLTQLLDAGRETRLAS